MDGKFWLRRSIESVALALLLAGCAKHGGDNASPAPAAPAQAATNGVALATCTEAQISDYQTAVQPCLDLDDPKACRDSVQSFFAKAPQLDCVSNNVELRTAPASSGLDDLLSSPIAADSSAGLCGAQVEADYAAIVIAACKGSSTSAEGKKKCADAASDFLKKYPDVDCHPEAARAGEPVRAWRLRALSNSAA